MFSGLSNILGTQKPRHAEQNDTRQDIQRHDPEYERRRKKKQPEKEDILDLEDGANVSVQALKAFLSTFLKELSQKEPKEGFNNSADTGETTKKSELSDPKPLKENNSQAGLEHNSEQKQVSGHAAYAANTYQHIAQNAQNTSILGEINESNADLITLEASEVRTIHALLEDLKLLEDKSIEYIHIERASSFLESLVNAVSKVKESATFKS